MSDEPLSEDYVPDWEQCTLAYVQWYQDDFVGGVRGMRAHEIGIYTMLLMEMYARGRAISMSDDRLARLCGADVRTFRKTLAMLIDEGKVIKLACGLWNERCENAFRSRAKMKEQQSEAARTSWENRNKNNGRTKRAQSERNASAMPISEAQKNIDSEAKASAQSASPGVFAEGLAIVVRMTGKPEDQARKIIGRWRKTTGNDDAKILAKLLAAERQKVADVVAWVTAALTVDEENAFLWARG